MTVKIVTGNLFESQAQTLVNAVNCVGVMGKGIALEFKTRFPDMYEDYVARCQRHEVQLGLPYLYKRPSPPHILNFPTKDHWRSKSDMNMITRGLDVLAAHYYIWGIESLAVPALGAGLGGLDWRVVFPVLYQYLTQLEIPVELYKPQNIADKEL